MVAIGWPLTSTRGWLGAIVPGAACVHCIVAPTWSKKPGTENLLLENGEGAGVEVDDGADHRDHRPLPVADVNAAIVHHNHRA